MSRDPSHGSPDGPKSVGAYYTPPPVARALCAWALRSAGETALDPAAGDGVFLLEAARRLKRLGGSPRQVRGVEMRYDAARDAAARLEAGGAAGAALTMADFLSLGSAALPPVDAVVGNPPYVRFQRLSADRRHLAARLAEDLGVCLDPLASSWPAFVLHASTFLRPGGRLALVLPSEIGHARYARSVLEFLRTRFASATFVLFETALFPQLDQGTVLLLADGYGRPFSAFAAARLRSASELSAGLATKPVTEIDAAALARGETRLHHAWLPAEAGELLARLSASRHVSRLADRYTVSIGYVTGHNAFFHLSPAAAERLGLPPDQLRRALFRGRALRGLCVTEADWARGAELGLSGYLLAPGGAGEPHVAAYLQQGATAGVPARAKVRQRRPWYRVTRTDPPALVLTAMSARSPRLAVNAARASVSNTLHAVRPLATTAPSDAPLLALAALTSLAELSAELEGHALGGGLLKLEPSEAARLQLPLPAPGGPAAPEAARGAPRTALLQAFSEADRALRAGEPEAARRAADRALLDELPCIGADGAATLAEAAERLRALRRRRRLPT